MWSLILFIYFFKEDGIGVCSGKADDDQSCYKVLNVRRIKLLVKEILLIYQYKYMIICD